MSTAADRIEWTMHERRYQVGAVEVLLRSNDRTVARAYDWAYRGSAVRRVRGARIAGGAAARPAAVVLEARRVGHWWRRDRCVEIYSNGQQRATIRRAADALAYLDWAANWAIATALPEFLLLHAACLERDGAGLVLAGQPESGKSTLAAALLLSGWRYLSDEFALVEPASGWIDAYPKALSLKGGTVALLRRGGWRVPAPRVCRVPGVGPVSVLPPTRVRADAVAARCPVRTIVFPRVTPGGESTLRPVSEADALMRLNRCCFNFLDYRAGGIRILENLVRQADCHELCTSDLRRATESLAQAHHAARQRWRGWRVCA
ncbi:MAG: hypothetical protein U1A27_01935 [Phycisphaerae bacterium]